MEKLKEAIRECLNEDNFYVRHFMEDYAEDDIKDCEDGKWYHQTKTRKLSENESLKNAIEDLIDDQTGYFEELITEKLRDEVVEYMRKLFREVANV